MKKLKFWQKLLIYLPCSIACFFIISVLIGLIYSLGDSIPIVKAMFKPLSILLSAVITYGGTFLFFIFKLAKLSPHAEQKGTRFGERRFQTKSELKRFYNTFNSLEELHTLDVTSGVLIRAESHKNNLSITQIAGSNCLVNGTSRSGKTQCYVSPQIQVWANSAVKPSFCATDPKGELFATNSKVLQENGYNVLVLNLASPFESKRYNPLAIIEKLYKQFLLLDKKTSRTLEEEKERRELKNTYSAQLTDMCLQLMPSNSDSKDAYWTDKGRNLLKGLILARLEDFALTDNAEAQKHIVFSQISSLISQPPEALQDYVNLREDISDARIALAETINNPAEGTRGSIFSTATQILDNLNEEGIKYISSKNEFDFDEILKKPTAIFVIIPDDNKSRNILATIFITQLYKFLISNARTLPGNKYKKPFFFLLEEFGTTETIPDIADWLNISGGRNIWFILVIQEINQLYAKYGREKSQSIIAGCQLMNYILAKNSETLSLFSDVFGKTTKLQTNSSLDKDNHVSFSQSEVNEALITPSELQKIAFEECVFVNSRDNPCKSNLIAIYRNKPFWRKGCIDKELLKFEILPPDFFIYRVESIITNYKNASSTHTTEVKATSTINPFNQYNNENIAEETKEMLKDCVIDNLFKLKMFFSPKQIELLVQLVKDDNTKAFWDCLACFKEQLNEESMSASFYNIYQDIEYIYQF